VFKQIAELNAEIKELDRTIRAMIKRYPAAQALMKIHGVGELTSLAYVLTVEDPGRIAQSRSAGAYFGLVPGSDDSGEEHAQRRITKEGDRFCRRLLVSAAQYILGPFGRDCNLQRHGRAIAARGGKNAKKRAAVAVARKLAVVMHRLWISGEVYDPFYGTPSDAVAA
jgi:transposase